VLVVGPAKNLEIVYQISSAFKQRFGELEGAFKQVLEFIAGLDFMEQCLRVDLACAVVSEFRRFTEHRHIITGDSFLSHMCFGNTDPDKVIVNAIDNIGDDVLHAQTNAYSSSDPRVTFRLRHKVHDPQGIPHRPRQIVWYYEGTLYAFALQWAKPRDFGADLGMVRFPLGRATSDLHYNVITKAETTMAHFDERDDDVIHTTPSSDCFPIDNNIDAADEDEDQSDDTEVKSKVCF
jgi:hypothetical protein